MRRPGAPRDLRISATADDVPVVVADFLPPASNGGSGEQMLGMEGHSTTSPPVAAAAGLHGRKHVCAAAPASHPSCAMLSLTRSFSVCAAVLSYLVRGTSPGRPTIQISGLPAPLPNDRVRDDGHDARFQFPVPYCTRVLALLVQFWFTCVQFWFTCDS